VFMSGVEGVATLPQIHHSYQRIITVGIQINIGDHNSPVSGYVSVPSNKRSILQWVRTRAISVAQKHPPANTYFKSLPGGRTLMQILNDSSIWINYHATLTLFGEAQISGKELAIGPNAFKRGKWVVLGTLIHELAHINGAPAGISTAAEDALYFCGLGTKEEYLDGVDDPRTPYDPSFGG
jgi:hypothetical protein